MQVSQQLTWNQSLTMDKSMVQRTLSLLRQAKNKLTKRCLRTISHAPTTGKSASTFWIRKVLFDVFNVWPRRKRVKVAVRY